MGDSRNRRQENSMRALRIPLVLLALSALALAAVSAAPPSSPSPFRYRNLYCRTLMSNGKTQSKVDLVIVGDGYLKAHLASGGKFEQDCGRIIRYLFTEPPFERFRSFFNVHAVYLESLEGGEKVNGVQWPRMALGTKFLGMRGYIDPILYQYDDKVVEAAENAPDYDIVMVMVNVFGTGASHWVKSERKRKLIPAPCFSTEGNDVCETATHELGHSLGRLGDEYESVETWDSHPMPAEGDLPFPNLSRQGFIDPADAATIRKTAKWGHFMDVPGAAKYVSAFQGGYYRHVGVYRPSFTCKMRDHSDKYCLVCQEALVKEIYRICGLVFDDAKYHRENPVR